MATTRQTVALLAASLLANAAAISPIMAKYKDDFVQRQRDIARDELRVRGAAPPAAEFFNQTLDHFNVLNAGSWAQRFWVNPQFVPTNGSSYPLFLYVEGEGAGSPYSTTSGQHFELAANHSALIISLEHRFYGASIPTKDLSVESMGYLSSHQAVGDIARFLEEYVPTKWNVSKTVTFGEQKLAGGFDLCTPAHRMPSPDQEAFDNALFSLFLRAIRRLLPRRPQRVGAHAAAALDRLCLLYIEPRRG